MKYFVSFQVIFEDSFFKKSIPCFSTTVLNFKKIEADDDLDEVAKIIKERVQAKEGEKIVYFGISGISPVA